MGLQDCLNKFGSAITDSQREALENSKAAGMTDDQAIRAAQLMAHQNVVDIANRAVNEGGTLAPVSNPVTDMAQFQSRATNKINERIDAIRDEVKVLQIHFENITDLKAHFQTLVGKEKDLSDDKVLMDAILQFQWVKRAELKAGGAIMGISGKDQFELHENYRKMEAYRQDVEDKFVALAKELEDLKNRKKNILAGKGQGDQTFEQGPRLMALHNLTSENLDFSDKLGGLAVPSMAIVQEGTSLSGFGEITLIASKDLGDPAQLPIFDADGYTVRFPSPEYKPALARNLDPLINSMIPWEMLWETQSSLTYYVSRHMKDHPNPQLVIWHMMDSVAVKAWFLTEVHNESLKPKQSDVKPKFKWSWDNDVVAFFMDPEVLRDSQRQWEDPKRQAMLIRAGEVVKKAAIRSIMERRKGTFQEAEALFSQGANLNRDGSLSNNRFHELMYDVAQKGSKRLDTLSNVDMLNARMDVGNRNLEFKQWIENKVEPMMGEPTIKIGNKREPYNLDNIVRKMKGKLKGTEFMGDMMTEGLMRALAAHRFKRLEEMRARSEQVISDKDVVDALRIEAQAEMNLFLGQMSQFYTHADAQGYVDSFEAGDAARRAIVSWATQKGLGTANDLEEQLVRQGFEGLPDWLVDEGMMAAMTWLAVPVPYFEGKPQRAVMFEEFAGAVIPSDAGPDVRATLQKRGVPFKEYQVGPNIDEGQTRQDALTEFTEQLNNQGERTLFQSEIGLTSGLQTAAQTMPFTKTMKDGVEVGTDAKQILATLKKQPNVKQAEIDAIGLEEWIEGLGLRQSMAAGIAGEPYTGKTLITQEQLIEFISTGGVQVKETFYAGEDVLTTPINFTQERASEEAHFDSIVDFEYDTAYAEFSTEIFDMRDSSDPFGDNFTVYIDKDAGNVRVQVQETEEWLEVPGGWNNQEMFHAKQAMEKYIYDKRRVPGSAGPARWTRWTLDAPDRGPFNDQGDPINHREIVLHVPTVGGYNYLLEDLTEVTHPDAGLTLPTLRREEVLREIDLFWYIEARGKPSEGKGAPTRIQTFQIKKQDFPTIDEAKRYIMEEKPEGAPIGANFDSHAFPQKNIIAWMRVNDRMGPNGEKILFVDEAQSDLHQAGLTDGYNYTDAQKQRSYNELEALEVKATKMLQNLDEPFVGYDNGREALRVYRRDMIDEATNSAFRDPFENLTKKQHTMMRAAVAAWDKNEKIQAGGPTPNMPFKGDAWAELAMKRIIRLAVEGGYDQVAWTNAEQQLERYDIDEHFSKITWDPRDEMLVTYDNDDRMIDSSHRTQNDLEELFGAERLLEMNRSIDQKRSEWTIAPVYLSSKQRSDMVGEELAFADATATTGQTLESMSPNDIVLDDIDQFIGTYERTWLDQNGVAFALVDQNGEMVRQSGGDYQMWEYFDGAEAGRDDFAFSELPELTNIDVVDEEGKGLRRRYDELMVNVSNRALRKLDKSAKVKRGGIQMEGGGTVQGQRVEREGGGNLVSGEVDPGAFYVSVWSNDNEADKYDRKQISPRFDTYDEALKWHDNITLGYGNFQHGFDLTDQIREAAMEGQTLFQGGARASITFQKEAGAIIRMKSARDLSSFLHESAHLYLEMMADLSEMPDAAPGLVDDFAKTLNYLGVNSRREITREHHELWARSFEAYLREGKAPTAELQPLFTTFKGWMIRVYRQLNRLLGPGEELNDEIRGVFDRLVASDQQIAASEDFMGYVALFGSAEEMGVTQRVYDLYRSNMEEAHDEAVDHESLKMIKAMQWSQQQWWKDERNKLAEQIRADVEKDPVYKALYFLQRGKNPDGTESQMAPFKLSGTDLKRLYGKDFIKRLPGRGKYGVYSAKGGVDVDVAASMFGFSSGNELVQALIKAPKMEDYIQQLARKQMEELHPDPLNSAEMVDDATRAVHNEKRGRVLAAELSALRKAQRENAKAVAAERKDQDEGERKARDANKGQLPKRENLAQIKAAAKLVVEQKRIRDINPNVYLQAERKAGRLAFEAMARKDYETAYAQKRKQIMNHEAYRAAIKAKAQAARDQKYLKTFEKKAKRIRMGKAGMLEQIDAVLEGINFRTISNKKLDQTPLNRELLPAMRAAVEDGSLIIPEAVLKSMETPDGINWREMTVEEFAAVRDVIKQLEHKAKTDLEVIINGEKVIIQEAVDAVASSITENNKVVAIPRGEATGGRKFVKSVREGVGHWLRSSSIARILDDSGFGAVTRNIIVPIRRAYVEKLVPRLHKATEDVAQIYKRHYSNDELIGLSKKIEDSNLSEDMSKSDILALALNWGSESNRSAVLGGMMKDANGVESPAFTEQEVALLLAKLDARDWKFVQDIWDYQDSHYAELAETEKRRRGIAPQRIEALAFTIRTSDGEEVSVRGGYHPLQYNSEHGGKVSEKDFEDYFNRMANGSYVSTSTRAGATYERTKNHGKVVLLSLNTIDRNLRELIRDLTIGDEINLVNKILNSKEVANATNNTANSDTLKELKLWLSDSAVGELPAQSAWEKGLSWTRVGFTKSKLAFNIYVTALQITGIFQSAAVLGTKNYSIGVGKFITNPVGNYKMVMEKSKFMEARYGILQTWDKDVQDTNNFMSSIFGPTPTRLKGAVDTMGHYYFYPIAKMQSVVDVTTWMGAYEKGLNELQLDEDAAGLYADTQVEASQTSGLFSDRSGIERGTLGTRTRQSQFVRLWTTLISYMLAKGNIAYEKGASFKKKPTMMGAVQLATDYLLLFMVEGIASALLYGQLPGDEDEDETVPGWIAKVTAESVMSGIPLVREYSSAKYGGGNTPIGALVMDMYKFNYQMSQGELDEALVKSGVKVVGTLFHLPASQVNRAVEAAMSDDDSDLYEYFTGKRDK